MSGIGSSGTFARRGRNHETLWWTTSAIGVVGVAASSIFILAPGVSATPSGKVTICHATASQSNPYTANTVDTSSVNETGNKFLNGHGTHTGPVFEPGVTSKWGDIIPPFTDEASGVSFPGMNWTSAGQQIWSQGCRYIVQPTPTPTETQTESPTPTPTQTQTESPTPTPTETQTESPSPTPTPTPTQTQTESPTPTPTPPLTPIITEPPVTTTPPAPTTTPPDIIVTPPVIPPDPLEPTETVVPPVETGNPSPPVDNSQPPTGPEPGNPETPGTNPVNNPGSNPGGIFPIAVDAGEGPAGLAGNKPAWLWLIPAGFLALASRSAWLLGTRR